jgi:hypothetical protein
MGGADPGRDGSAYCSARSPPREWRPDRSTIQNGKLAERRENLVANLCYIRTKIIRVFLNVLPRLRCCCNLVLGCF